MSTPYSSAEVERRARELLPQITGVSRGGHTDVDDILDSIRERVARALYADVDGLFYLAHLAVQRIRQLLLTLETSAATIAVNVSGLRTAPAEQSRRFVGVDAYSLVAAIPAATPTQQKQLVKEFSRAVTQQVRGIRNSTGSIDVAVPRGVAEERLHAALMTFAQARLELSRLWVNVADMLDLFNSVDFRSALIARQARQALSALTPSTTTDTSDPLGALMNLLVAQSLLDVDALVPDYYADKYTGYALGTNHTYHDEVTLAVAPAAAYAPNPGDTLLTAGGVLIGTIVAITGNTLKVTPPGYVWAASPGTEVAIQGAARDSYFALQKNMRAASVSLRKLAELDLPSVAAKYAYSGAGSSNYADVRSETDAALVALSAAVAGFSVAAVSEVQELIVSLREDKLLPVLDSLLKLDFYAIRYLGAQGLSTAESAAEIMEEVANLLGADLPNLDLSEGGTTLSDYYERRHDE